MTDVGVVWFLLGTTSDGRESKCDCVTGHAMYFIIAAESGLNNSVGAFVNAIFCIEWAAKRKVLLNLVEMGRRFVLGQVPLHFPEWQCRLT